MNKVRARLVTDEFLPTTNVMPPREIRDRVYTAYLERKLNPEEIARELHLPLPTVTAYLSKINLEQRADEIKEMVKQAVLEDKVPILQAIADIGLLSVYEWLSDFFKTNKHKTMKIPQAKHLVELVEKLHNMYRLEIGASTANIDMQIQKTHRSISVILSDLKKPPEQGGDPFGVIEVEKSAS